jgi:hypothetical protein
LRVLLRIAQEGGCAFRVLLGIIVVRQPELVLHFSLARVSRLLGDGFCAKEVGDFVNVEIA